MKIDIKDHVDSNGMGKMEKLEKVLIGLQKYYLKEFQDIQKKLEDVKKVIDISPDILKPGGNSGKY